MTLDQVVGQMRSRINPLARLTHAYAATLRPPTLNSDEGGFRYLNPDHRHFCLLRACRVISALSAGLELLRCGYSQEIGILIRVVQEATGQISAVLAQITENGALHGKLKVFVEDYFSDRKRSETVSPTYPSKLSQKFVNETIGAELDAFNALSPGDPGFKSAADRFWHLDWVFSNYVHGRYPETMDLYGGTPGRFHLAGMSGTPKDLENMQILDEVILSASRCFVRLAQAFDLRALIAQDPVLIVWYRKLGDA